MSLLSVTPDLVSAASGDLENLGSALRSATAAAAGRTTAVAAPAADQVSQAVAALLGTHGEEFQTINAQAAAFHDEFVSRLSGGGAQYAGTEVANAQALLGPAAAANPAETIGGFPGSSQSFNVGPFGISLSTTSVSFGTGGFLGAASAGLSLNTPFGSTPLLAASGIELIYPTGQFALSLGQTVPLVNYAASMTGSLAPAVQITGLTVGLNNVLVSFPGTYLGGLLPNVSIQ